MTLEFRSLRSLSAAVGGPSMAENRAAIVNGLDTWSARRTSVGVPPVRALEGSLARVLSGIDATLPKVGMGADGPRPGDEPPVSPNGRDAEASGATDGDRREAEDQRADRGSPELLSFAVVVAFEDAVRSVQR